MSRRPSCVLDTNVVVSGLLFPRGKPGQVLQWAMENGKVLLSLPVFLELNDVLRRKKFDRYLSADDRQEFLLSLEVSASLVHNTETLRICRDPKDDKFLELAVAGKADYLVSGDRDLLDLNPFRNVVILTPDQFLAIVIPGLYA